MKVLIANRGEVAIRIARAAADLGMASVAVYSADDVRSLHTLAADEAVALEGIGPAAYLDTGQLLETAQATGCGLVHPGYGFLSEDPAFAGRCEERGLVFVGPSAATLAQVGDKVRARALAGSLGIPVVEGSGPLGTVEEAIAAFDSLGAVPAIIKGIAGGGGIGLRVVERAADVPAAFEACRSEVTRAFGHGEVFLERYLPSVRHVEVQIVGDGDDVVHLWERDCSIQRRRQKLIEVAPAPFLDATCRQQMLQAATAFGTACAFAGVGTVEFLVEAGSSAPGYHFMECNPRLQVEHTVTEAVAGWDLVQTQLRIAAGASLAEQGLTQDRIGDPRGIAMQVRLNTETIDRHHHVHPSAGTLAVFEPPSGPQTRVDTHGYAGFAANPSFDSLLAKVVVHTLDADLPATIRKAQRALSEFRIEGIETNRSFLQALLARPELPAWDVDTRFVETHLSDLLEGSGESEASQRFFAWASPGTGAPTRWVPPIPADDAATGVVTVGAPLQGVVASIDVEVGDSVAAGQQVAVLEAMKMHHVVAAPGGVVRAIAVRVGEVIDRGQPIVVIDTAEAESEMSIAEEVVDLDAFRPDLAELEQRIALTLDENRPDAVERRRQRGQRTARENVDDLCDADSFLEYGQLIVAGQRRIRSMEDLMQTTPADGLVAGIGVVNGATFGAEAGRTVVLAYDFTVLAGTQGAFNHKKTDRLLELAHAWRLPVVFFTEGGGGRPGDTDFAEISVAGLDLQTFATFAALSGRAPRIAINSGYCFAGNAVLFGCADVTIATRNSSIGLAGPVMIEGAGLGSHHPRAVGPIEIQAANGVVDLVAEDEAEAVALARQALAYFQGPLPEWTCADQRALRHIVPVNRKRVYDMRAAIHTLADDGSVLELRRGYGPGMITCLVRVEGRSFGLFANDPRHLGGAIDAEAAEKTARFMQLCDAFDLPLISLCDTPGFMVGPESEQQAAVRRTASMMVTGATLSVPVFMVCLRKGYGLGAMAMGAGSLRQPFSTVSWPTGEFGAMGLEGAVELVFRRQLEAAEDEAARRTLLEQRVSELYEKGKALSAARYLEIDAVIDPADTRRWLVSGAQSASTERAARPPKRPFVDTW
jgi:acetyl/propionyl-CoA carboxylase alpha subunit/acetyl-CoA carboxylase carboxyltransferase component